MTRLRVLTWNVQHAAASRTHQQARWLATTDPPDVLVLTEVVAGATGRLLARLLGEFGYTVHLPEAGLDRYRVLLACRTGVLDVVSETGVECWPPLTVPMSASLTMRTGIGHLGRCWSWWWRPGRHGGAGVTVAGLWSSVRWRRVVGVRGPAGV
jgi:Endonuclease/Exonuclease/phosphatase family